MLATDANGVSGKRKLGGEKVSADSAAKRAAVRDRKECTHAVALPVAAPTGGPPASNPPRDTLDEAKHGTLDDPRWTGEMAKTYPFPLDPFQQTSIACLERQESVMVAAHTSAGKTVVAEYAIAMAFRDKQRVIYTSPIKALSNQKFRELEAEFGDVGLMTGDVTQSPNANCVVMTTEILRSMLYRGSDILREVAWVIFDEIHYMQDKERGVVWEETIIFLPPEAKMVFLSATLSNSHEFADWIASVHRQPCHVVSTDYRPTPLLHYAFPMGGKGMHLVLDDKGQFKSQNWGAVMNTLKEAKGDPRDEDATGGGGGRGAGRGGRGRGGRGRGRGRGGRGPGVDEKQDKANSIVKLIKVIKHQSYDPVIFFSFGRRECEAYAGQCAKLAAEGKIPAFLAEEDLAHVDEIFDNAVSCLSEEDRVLKPVVEMKTMLQQGIAVHHSGLLPILKEIIELLFQEGYVKALFATETFAMGVNMPARTVVFTVLQKFDGECKRWIHSGEYTQMSGRAGRRGLDDCGRCILILGDEMPEEDAKHMLQGKAAPLMSSFKLTYYTLLNLLRRMESSGQGMEHVIAKSFQQFQQERNAPELEAEVKRLEAEAAGIEVAQEGALQEYSALRAEIAEQQRALMATVMLPANCIAYMPPGRLVRVELEREDWGYGVVVSVMRGQTRGIAGSRKPASAADVAANAWTIDVLLPVVATPEEAAQPFTRAASTNDSRAEMQVVPVQLGHIAEISQMRVSVPEDLKAANSRASVLVSLRKFLSQHKGDLPRLDPIADMDIRDEELEAAVERIQGLEAKLVANPFYKTNGKTGSDMLDLFHKKARLQAEADSLRKELRQSQLTTFKQEAKRRQAVLRRLQHVDDHGTVLLKGRAACEIDTADELLTTELMFNGVFSGLDIHQLVALASCLVPVERSNEQIQLKTGLAAPLGDLQRTARYIAEISNEEKIEVEVEDYVESFKPSLMDVIYNWSKGASFQKICDMTDIFEGSIIRATRRLDELMRQMENAARAVGDEDLATKFSESAETIRRDIMFAASLYV